MFTAPTIHGPAGLKGLDGIAALGSLALAPTAFTATFGRVARAYPAMPRCRAPLAPLGTAALDRGLVAAGTRLVARALARLADAVERHGQQWARARTRRLTERALRRVDGRTLRDIGLTHGEIDSMAAEVAGEIEATRARLWREIGCRVV